MIKAPQAERMKSRAFINHIKNRLDILLRQSNISYDLIPQGIGYKGESIEPLEATIRFTGEMNLEDVAKQLFLEIEAKRGELSLANHIAFRVEPDCIPYSVFINGIKVNVFIVYCLFYWGDRKKQEEKEKQEKQEKQEEQKIPINLDELIERKIRDMFRLLNK